MAGARFYTLVLLFLCLVGIFTSLYAYYVEFAKEKDSSYTALCDISAAISCSKVFTSKYGRGFGLLEFVIGRDHYLNMPNSVFGIIFYIIQIILTVFFPTPTMASFQVFLSIIANMGSIYLGYILRYVLEDFCVVCVSMYVVNFLILVINVLNRRHLISKSLVTKKKRQ